MRRLQWRAAGLPLCPAARIASITTWAALPELMHLALAPYLGEEAAREGLSRPAPRPATRSAER